MIMQWRIAHVNGNLGAARKFEDALRRIIREELKSTAA